MIPIYNKFNGIDSLDLKWKISGKRYNIVFPDDVPKFREAVNTSAEEYHLYRKPELESGKKKGKVKIVLKRVLKTLACFFYY
jgi:hypothetical protein